MKEKFVFDGIEGDNDHTTSASLTLLRASYSASSLGIVAYQTAAQNALLKVLADRLACLICI
jgi:hypothetical protein